MDWAPLTDPILFPVVFFCRIRRRGVVSAGVLVSAGVVVFAGFVVSAAGVVLRGVDFGVGVRRGAEGGWRRGVGRGER